MTTQTVAEQVRWQDLKVRSEIDIVLEIAKTEGWVDCEVFGYGDMIKQPHESMGWKLIPADIYKYSIPTAAIARLHQIINAGIRVRGVIIADDQRRIEPLTTPAAAPPKVSLASVKPIVSWIGKARSGLIRSLKAVASFSGKALLGLIHSVRAAASWSGKAFLGLIRAVAVIAVVSVVAVALIHLWPVALFGLLVFAVARAGMGTGTSSDYDYDPKLVILVDDGRGGTVWVSLFTWYD